MCSAKINTVHQTTQVCRFQTKENSAIGTVNIIMFHHFIQTINNLHLSKRASRTRQNVTGMKLWNREYISRERTCTSGLREQFHMNNVHMRTQSFPDVNHGTPPHIPSPPDHLSTWCLLNIIQKRRDDKLERDLIRTLSAPWVAAPLQVRPKAGSCASRWLSNTQDHPLKENCTVEWRAERHCQKNVTETVTVSDGSTIYRDAPE